MEVLGSVVGTKCPQVSNGQSLTLEKHLLPSSSVPIKMTHVMKSRKQKRPITLSSVPPVLPSLVAFRGSYTVFIDPPTTMEWGKRKGEELSSFPLEGSQVTWIICFVKGSVITFRSAGASSPFLKWKDSTTRLVRTSR